MTRKESIMKAATELFACQGFDGTAASEIARKAGVAHGTVFHHFKSKEKLLVSICDELVRAYVAGVTEAAEGTGTGWESLERVLRFSLVFLKDRAESISVAFRETHAIKTDAREVRGYFRGLMTRIIDVFEECIEMGQADGSIRDVPKQETAYLLHVLIKGIHHSFMHGLLDRTLSDATVVDFCRRALASQPQDDIRLD